MTKFNGVTVLSRFVMIPATVPFVRVTSASADTFAFDVVTDANMLVNVMGLTEMSS